MLVAPVLTMRRLQAYLSEDSNQYGPGTDLIVSLMSVLLIIIFINSNLYQQEREKNHRLERGGNFKVASDSFSAGDFKAKPYKEFVNREQAIARVKRIAQEYETLKKVYPYIFVIGHSNRKDDKNALDKSDNARMVRNWEYAGQRAALISSLLQDFLQAEDKDKLVVVTTGEFDMRVADPFSQENAWVEVVFGTEWKPPARKETK
jgi:hypothetical protein